MTFVQDRLLRMPLRPLRGSSSEDRSLILARQLGNLVSIKGEDIMLLGHSSDQVRYHRLRASVPSRLWKWRVFAGWKWTGQPEHINALELRAILTSLLWRVGHQAHLKTRFLHLTDSMVCLHALSRGRSSSKKLRRTLSRINALLLASGSQGQWGYVHTDSNGLAGSRPNIVMGKKRILEGTTVKQRAEKRQKLGTLKQLTVQAPTRIRYDKAIDNFFQFLKSNSLQLPRKRELLDGLVCEYLEHLWSSGQGRGLASDSVAALQDHDPKLRGTLPGSWSSVVH